MLRFSLNSQILKLTIKIKASFFADPNYNTLR